ARPGAASTGAPPVAGRGCGRGGAAAEPAVSPTDAPKVATACAAYRTFFASRYSTPGVPAWDPEHLEYSFRLRAPIDMGDLLLDAAEYPGGTLDWHSFDAEMTTIGIIGPPVKRTETVLRTLLPAPLRSPGMAADRWWQFEDGRVNLNKIDGDADDLLRLALIDFSLLYANDWFVVPVDLAPGSVFFMDSVIVTDAFGERTTIPHYSRSARPDPEWRLFVVRPFSHLLFPPPVRAGRPRREAR